ncbi:hypothetical protein ABQF26_40920, partial [Mycolicibacterium elephantis]
MTSVPERGGSAPGGADVDTARGSGHEQVSRETSSPPQPEVSRETWDPSAPPAENWKDSAAVDTPIGAEAER